MNAFFPVVYILLWASSYLILPRRSYTREEIRMIVMLEDEQRISSRAASTASLRSALESLRGKIRTAKLPAVTPATTATDVVKITVGVPASASSLKPALESLQAAKPQAVSDITTPATDVVEITAETLVSISVDRAASSSSFTQPSQLTQAPAKTSSAPAFSHSSPSSQRPLLTMTAAGNALSAQLATRVDPLLRLVRLTMRTFWASLGHLNQWLGIPNRDFRTLFIIIDRLFDQAGALFAKGMIAIGVSSFICWILQMTWLGARQATLILV